MPAGSDEYVTSYKVVVPVMGKIVSLYSVIGAIVVFVFDSSEDHSHIHGTYPRSAAELS